MDQQQQYMDEDELYLQLESESYRPSPHAPPSALSDVAIQVGIQSLKNQLHIAGEEDIIHLPPSEIQKVTRWTDAQTKEFISRISIDLCKNIITGTALEMLAPDSDLRPRKLSTGDSVLDRCLGGGFLTKSLTEIAGEAGSGKTQIALQLALQAQLPLSFNGLAGRALYITTESEVPVTRLMQLAEHFYRRHRSFLDERRRQREEDADRERTGRGHESDENEGDHVIVHATQQAPTPSPIPAKSAKTIDPLSDVCDQVFVEMIPTIDRLWELLDNKLPRLVNRENVRLVVIDSIAALFRAEYAAEESVLRAKLLHKHARQLKLLADSFDMCVVAVNQVSDYFDRTPVDRALLPPQDNFSGPSKVIPALGLTWSNCVNTRVMLTRTKRTIAPSVVLSQPHVLYAQQAYPQQQQQSQQQQKHHQLQLQQQLQSFSQSHTLLQPHAQQQQQQQHQIQSYPQKFQQQQSQSSTHPQSQPSQLHLHTGYGQTQAYSYVQQQPTQQSQQQYTQPQQQQPQKRQKMNNHNTSSAVVIPASVTKRDDVVVRNLHIVLASHLPNRGCSFVVDREGVIGIDEQDN